MKQGCGEIEIALMPPTLGPMPFTITSTPKTLSCGRTVKSGLTVSQMQHTGTPIHRSYRPTFTLPPPHAFTYMYLPPQVQSDIVTLADHKKWQSIGHMDVCPRTGLPFIVANGFRHVDDKSNQLCSADMEAQSMLFFGKKQLHFANSIVTDVGAFGVASELIKNYPFGTELHRSKCMMHQTSKVANHATLPRFSNYTIPFITLFRFPFFPPGRGFRSRKLRVQRRKGRRQTQVRSNR